MGEASKPADYSGEMLLGPLWPYSWPFEPILRLWKSFCLHFISFLGGEAHTWQGAQVEVGWHLEGNLFPSSTT